MRWFIIKISTISAGVALAAFSLVGSAGASHVKVDLLVPDQPVIGQPMQVQADFHTEGKVAPIAGLTVAFHEAVTIGGVTGDVDLGSAVTDANGVASLTYRPRTAGSHEIHVRYAYQGGDAEDAAASFSVPPAGEQLYHSTAGVSIPGLSSWALMALVAVVWVILLSVAVRVIAIAQAGTVEAEVARQSRTVGRAQVEAGGPRA
jgi:hypothetical protein